MTQRLPGIGLPASDLASDGVSGSECYERSKTFVTLSLSGYLFSTDSVHVVLCGLFIGRTCRSHRTVCHRCKFRYSISNADVIFDPFGQKWPIATHTEDLSPEDIQKRAADRFGQKPAEHQQPLEAGGRKRGKVLQILRGRRNVSERFSNEGEPTSRPQPARIPPLGIHEHPSRPGGCGGLQRLFFPLLFFKFISVVHDEEYQTALMESGADER